MTPPHRVFAGLCVVLFILVSFVSAKDDNAFSHLQKVPVKVNKVGPYRNPTETYTYYSLPFCSPPDVSTERQNFEKSLEGDRLMPSLYDVRFRGDTDFVSLCTIRLSPKSLKKFRNAVMENYYGKYYLDGLPLWVFLGEQRKNEDPVLFLHHDFSIGYNGKHVVEANVTANRKFVLPLPSDPQESVEVEFSYSVRWSKNERTFEKRMERYETYSFFERQVGVQWFSVINSFILILLLVALVAYILLRILRKDYERIGDMEKSQDEIETRWKALHAYVFRFPPFLMPFSAILGTGVQLLCLCAALFVLGLFNAFSISSRGTLYTGIIVCYALTTWILGYYSTNLYLSMGGKKWVHNCILSTIFFPLPVFIIWFILNTVAVSYESTSALPFGVVATIFFAWVLVAFPLSVFGAIYGKNNVKPFEAPCRTSRADRLIPSVPWFRSNTVIVTMCGLIAFGSVYVEMYYMFLSIWGHGTYTPYIILFLGFFILVVVTSSLSIAATYMQLSQEDHRWWWRSVVGGAAGGGFVFLHGFMFLLMNSQMSGFLQLSFFFGYSAVLAFAFALMLGTVAYLASLKFVKVIYSMVKFD